MRILISSYSFYPDVGGIETVTALLAREWTRQGHTVEIATQSPGDSIWEGIMVHRVPSRRTLRGLVRSADLYFQNHLSLQLLWPVLDMRRKIVALHQTYLTPYNRPRHGAFYLKRSIAELITNLAISQAVAAPLGFVQDIVGNPYEDAVFKKNFLGERLKDLVFVGRLVSDKGVDVLLHALARLRECGESSLQPKLTIVGTGPEEPKLRALVQDLALSAQVIFHGQATGPALCQLLNEHRIMVVPSSWPEPFGIVALEGAACGCLIIGSNQGGLPEAIGPAGVTFPNKDASELSQQLRRALTGLIHTDEDAVNAHLACYQLETYAKNLLARIQ